MKLKSCNSVFKWTFIICLLNLKIFGIRNKMLILYSMWQVKKLYLSLKNNCCVDLIGA
jgi:hypothetical protein